MAAGCQSSFPADSQGSLERVTGGELRIGIAENPPFTEVAPDGAVSGSEVELITAYAETIDAEIHWVPAGENALAAEMVEGNIDLVIGGLASDVPWTSEITLTRPYTSTLRPGRQTRGHRDGRATGGERPDGGPRAVPRRARR